MTFNENLFTFKGRRNRLSFLAIQLVLTAGGLGGAVLLAGFNTPATGVGNTGIAWLFIASLLPVIWVNIAVTVQRMNDLEIGGFWFVLWFLPLICWGFFLYLLLRKGTTGPNKNGPDPLAA